MRLIDADELIRRIEADKEFAKHIPSNVSDECLNGFYKGYVIGEIILMPTAYDVDKVVEEMEEQKIIQNKDGILEKQWNRAINNAIEIVKKG